MGAGAMAGGPTGTPGQARGTARDTVTAAEARTIARLYLTSLCKAATGELGEPIPEIPPPLADLDRSILQAPPMTGLEYLTPEVLSNWWRDLVTLTRIEIAQHPGGAQGYLRERNSQWRSVGRVTFHLAENRRDPERPFAFLATFANGLTAQGKVKHEPLGRALQQYAGEKNRAAGSVPAARGSGRRQVRRVGLDEQAIRRHEAGDRCRRRLTGTKTQAKQHNQHRVVPSPECCSSIAG